MAESAKRKNIKGVAVKFYLYTFGYLFVYSPMIAVVGLQSSVNIEEGLGTLSLGVAYLVSFLFVIFATPTLVRRFGCKWTFIAGEATYLLYVAANYYPIPCRDIKLKRAVFLTAAYIMFTAGVLLGIGDAVIWPVLQMFNVHFGRLQAQYGSQPGEHYVQKYTGHFYAIYQFAQLVGNGISYAVLYGLKNKKNDTSPAINESTSAPADPYQYCGANDCQDPNVTDTNIDQYVPTSMISFYILVTVYCVMCAVGLIMHARFLPSIGVETAQEQLRQADANNLTQEEADAGQPKVYTAPSVKKTLADTFKHMIRPKQLLLTPASLYDGFCIVFYLSEVTRAYSSCVLGVEQVGLGLMLFSVASISISLSVRRIISLLGRSGLVLANLVLDTSIFLFCLLWRPEDSTAFLIYFIFVAVGISNGAWQNNLIAMYREYFPDNQEISFSIWNTWITVGVAVAYTSASLLCVSTKIYIMLGFLAFSVVSYGAAEYIHRMEQRKGRE